MTITIHGEKVGGARAARSPGVRVCRGSNERESSLWGIPGGRLRQTM